MASCPKCSQEIADGASVCKHCHAEIGKPKRPTGVTVIAILTLLGSVFGLFAIFGLNETNSIILGIRVPVIIARAFGLIGNGIGIYCGIGFLKQLALARKVYIWVAIYGIANSLITTPVLMNTMRLPDEVKTGMIIGMIIGVGITGWILYYVVRRKDYFTN